jgi:predicted Zn-ribbon and HTH transcriptional regulator
MDAAGASSQGQAVCSMCGYSWRPRKRPEDVRRCPNCYSRQWMGQTA